MARSSQPRSDELRMRTSMFTSSRLRFSTQKPVHVHCAADNHNKSVVRRLRSKTRPTNARGQPEQFTSRPAVLK